MSNTARSTIKGLIPSRVLTGLRNLLAVAPGARVMYLKVLLLKVSGRTRRRDVAMLSRAKSVLFICHGNIMRSALANAALYERSRAWQRPVRVASAGLHATLDAAADARMSRAALARGISLEKHRATPLSGALVDAADVVFVMDYLNVAEILTRFPNVRSKLWLLGSLAPTSEDGDVIPDPFTGDDDTAARCAARVCRCIDELTSLLDQPRSDQIAS